MLRSKIRSTLIMPLHFAYKRSNIWIHSNIVILTHSCDMCDCSNINSYLRERELLCLQCVDNVFCVVCCSSPKQSCRYTKGLLFVCQFFRPAMIDELWWGDKLKAMHIVWSFARTMHCRKCVQICGLHSRRGSGWRTQENAWGCCVARG